MTPLIPEPVEGPDAAPFDSGLRPPLRDEGPGERVALLAPERLRAFRPLVLVFAGFVLVQVISAAVLFAMKLGLTPAKIELFYRGSELARPRTMPGMLAVMVPHLLAVPLTLFVIAHLVGWAGIVHRSALFLLTKLTFALVLVGLVAGLGVRYLWPALSVVKLGAFLGLELTLLLWVLLLAKAFWPSKRVLASQRLNELVA